MSEFVTELEKQLPDLLKAWEIALRSGYSLRQIVEATAEMSDTGRPMDWNSEYTIEDIMASVPYGDPDPAASEFRRVHQATQAGTPLLQAMEQMLERVPSEDLNLLLATLKAQREVGGNLADKLQVTSLVMRYRKRQQE